MSKKKMESLGIKRLEAIHYYVHNLSRSRRFYTQALDFAEIGISTPELEARTNQTSALFRAGECVVLVSQPTGEGGRAWRYLQKHPSGVGSLIFEVEDVEKTFALLESRGATPIDEIHVTNEGRGRLRHFSITTPFGDTLFRFLDRDGFDGYFHGLVEHARPVGGTNSFGFERFDHVTSNFLTMKPALLWLEHVLGFEPFWNVEFHTNDVAGTRDHGSGLKSVVMHDPHSDVKFANNEPARPFFRASQIFLFHEDQRGDGVQHVALTVKDILGAVRGLRARDVKFMPTPGTYYDALPTRIQQLGIGKIDEDIATLRELEILVDGDRDRSYMLQIFLKDAAATHGEAGAGPFFYEVIQRKGDQGFGAGNFRALFESIERQQKQDGRIP